MAELWSVMEFNPIKVINPTQSWGGNKKIRPQIRSSKCKKSSEKNSPQKVEKW